jgi:hypothetical protein
MNQLTKNDFVKRLTGSAFTPSGTDGTDYQTCTAEIYTSELDKQ